MALDAMTEHVLRDKRAIVIDRYVDEAAYRYNVYVCDADADACQSVTLSLEVDEGVTPMFVRCNYCGRTAASRGYPAGVPPPALFPVDIIWRKPTNGELKRERRDEGKGHFALGGLAMERIGG